MHIYYMTDIDIIRAQRDVLFEATKKVAMHKNCPDWIAKILSEAVVKSRKLQQEKTEATVETVEQIPQKLEVNSIVRSNIPKDVCRYKIEKIGPVIKGVQLFDVSIIKGDLKNPVGTIVHNVPATMLIMTN